MVELDFSRFVGAHDHRQRLLVAPISTRIPPDGMVRGHQILLQLIAHQRKGTAVERAFEFDSPKEGALVPGIIPVRGSGRPRGLWGQGLAQGELGGIQVSSHLHMRDIQGLTHLVEPVRFGVFGQKRLHLEVGQCQNLPQGVLVLVAVEAALGRPALGGETLSLRLVQQGTEGVGEPLQVGRGGAGHFLGRHFSRGHPVMHLHPAGEGGRFVQILGAGPSNPSRPAANPRRGIRRSAAR